MMPRARHLFERPIGVGAAMLAVLVLGAFSLRQLPLDLWPTDVQVPLVMVRMAMDTESSAEALEAVTRPAEEIVRGVAGVKAVESTTQGGSVSLRIEAAPGIRLDEMAGRLNEAFETGRNRLGALLRPPQVVPMFGGEQAMIEVAFAPGRLDGDAFQQAIERVLLPAALRVPGVSRVDHSAEGRGAVLITFDRARTTAARANPGSVAAHLVAAQPRGFVLPVLEDGVRREQIISIDAGDLAVARLPGLPVAHGIGLGDVAGVVREPAEKDRVVLVDGKPGVLMKVYRGPDANAYATSRAVAVALAAAADRVGVTWFEQISAYRLIDAALVELRHAAILGIAFSVAFLIAVLRRLRLALIICLCLPLSLVLGLVALAVGGHGLNIMALLGFLLATGIVVDNAIVVGEALMRIPHVNDRDERARRVQATLRSVALAITVSTLATLAIFVPLMVLSGNPWLKAYISALGRPVGWSLIASLAVAVVVVPAAVVLCYPRGAGVLRRAPRGARGAQPPETNASSPTGPIMEPSAPARSGWVVWCERVYGRVLAVLLRRLWLAIPVMVVLVAPGGWAVWAMGAGVMTISLGETDLDARVVVMPVRLRGNPTAEQVREQVAIWDATLAPHRERLGIVSTVADLNLGSGSWWGNGAYQVYLRAIDPQGRPIRTVEEEITALLPAGLHAALIATITALEAEAVPFEAAEGKGAKGAKGDSSTSTSDSARGGRGGGRGKSPSSRMVASYVSENGVQVRVTAPDFQLLDESWNLVRARFAEHPAVRDPGPLSAEPPQELELSLLPAAEEAGWRADQLAAQVTRFVGTRQVTVMPDGAALRTGPVQRATLDQLNALEITRADNTRDVLGSVVQLRGVPTATEIKRRDGLCQRTQWLGLHPGGKARLIADLPAIAASAGLAPGCNLDLGNLEQSDRDNAWKMQLALVLAVVISYLLMGVLYESALAPLTVIACLLPGAAVLVWLHLAGKPIDLMVLIGLLFLVGLVINHGIVLVDRLCSTVPLARVRRGPRVALALAAAARRRFAPVLLTSLTTIAAALPMALGSGRIAGIAIANLGLCLAVGLSVATVCTLVVVPVTYHWLGRARGTALAWLGWR